MTKRARYDGPYEEIAVYDPEGTVYDQPVDIVKKGGLLSADVRAPIRDELLEAEGWSEVNQAEHKAPDKKDEE